MARVLVVGDIMLDEFVYGDVHRISPEAATPVLSVSHITKMIGGAGNVARGVQALGTDCSLIGVLGDDRAGHDLTSALAEIDDPTVIVDMERPTTHKTRFVSIQHSTHLLRVDRESTSPLSNATEASVKSRIGRAVFDADVVVISDYCKGVITKSIAQHIIKEARAKNRLVIVDSKRADLSIFKGAHIVKLNAAELGRAYNATQDWIKVGFSHTDADTETLCSAGLSLAHVHGIDHLIITRGELGMLLLSNYSSTPVVIPGKVVRVRDVSGAGDTVIATLATRLAYKQDLVDALHVANDAAAIAVSKPGTAVVTAVELNGGMVAPVGHWGLLEQRLKEWQGKHIGFTNGCFDLLHPGHVHLLTQAKAQCGKLIVGINSDRSVRRLKGEGRPIQNEQTRAEMLAALDSIVDLVVIFDEDTPKNLCAVIQPNTMFKGDDYSVTDIVGREFANRVVIVPRIPDHSTTATIGRFK